MVQELQSAHRWHQPLTTGQLKKLQHFFLPSFFSLNNDGDQRAEEKQKTKGESVRDDLKLDSHHSRGTMRFCDCESLYELLWHWSL
jgi:hypothetical protein